MSRLAIRREPRDPTDEPGERFWHGMTAGLLLSSAVVGVLATLWTRMRGGSPGSR